ncbi:MAG: two-component sensor histidine kinase [Gammaproteobacteria bacterium]|nr:two-component sensor histidine kinase [Gammaproteobacteria bacterium]
MGRHFLGLYLLIVLTLAVVSWGQDKILQTYSGPETRDDKPMAVALFALANQLHGLPAEGWKDFVAGVARKTGVEVELFATKDIVGRETLGKLGRGEVAYMQASAGDSWALQRLDADYVLAVRSFEPATQRGPLEWFLTMLFYAAIALVLMTWIWPLTRDLRVLEQAAARFGNRNWSFDAVIKPHSQIYPLAQTFRRMAARIDGLIASHKDMSNAVSHEIRTPLSRMRFEIELAQQAADLSDVRNSLSHIKADIAAINDLVTATLGYAILERADVSLNIGAHDFTTLIPAIAESVRCDARPDILINTHVQSDADAVSCDIHLLETVLKNLLHNAIRYARHEISVTFEVHAGVNRLLVDDDGPGIPEQDRRRVFESFVQLDRTAGRKTGFGLGLAIVKRAIEWHGGEVAISRSPLGGARFCASWPAP